MNDENRNILQMKLMEEGKLNNELKKDTPDIIYNQAVVQLQQVINMYFLELY